MHPSSVSWPQPALDDISIHAHWDGDPEHPVEVDLAIEFTSFPSSRLCLIQHEHPIVKSAEVIVIKRTVSSSLPRPTLNFPADGLDNENHSPIASQAGTRRMLFTPPSLSPLRFGNIQSSDPETLERHNDSDENTPKPSHQAQRHSQRRSYLTSETPSGRNLVHFPRGEPTASTVEISPLVPPVGFRPPAHTITEQQFSPTPSSSIDIHYAKRDKSTIYGSRIPLPRQARMFPPQKARDISSDTKPLSRTPDTRHSTSPRGRKLVPNTAPPGRASPFAEPQMIQSPRGRKIKPRGRLMRSSSLGDSHYRDMSIQINPRETVAHWLQSNNATLGLHNEAFSHPQLPTPTDPGNYQPTAEGIGNFIENISQDPSCAYRPMSPHLASSYSKEDSSDDRPGKAKAKSPRGGPSKRATIVSTCNPTTRKAPTIESIDAWLWAFCLTDAEEESWTVALKATVFLERHLDGVYTLRIPGLPQQAGFAKGKYSITLQDPEIATHFPNYVSLQDRVQLVKTPSTLEKFSKGERHGTFSLGEDFSLRFLLQEHNRHLISSDFDVDYAFYEDHGTDSVGNQCIAYSLACSIHIAPFILWAEEVTFTLFIYGSPWDGAFVIPMLDDFVIEMGSTSDQILDNEIMMTFTKRVSELSRPIKLTWKQWVGPEYMRILPSVSTRQHDPDLLRSCHRHRISSTLSSHASSPDGALSVSDDQTVERHTMCDPSQGDDIDKVSNGAREFPQKLGHFDPQYLEKGKEMDSEVGDLNPYSGWDFFSYRNSTPSKTARNSQSFTLSSPDTEGCASRRLHASFWQCFIVFALCTLALIVATITRSESSGFPDFATAIVECRGRVANVSAVRNLPKEWWRWSPWQAYLEEQWGVDFVEIMDDPTGWRTLMDTIGEAAEGLEKEGIRWEDAEIEVESGTVEQLSDDVTDGNQVQDKTDSGSEMYTVDKGDVTVNSRSETAINVTPRDVERGMLGKIRDGVDYALGWRPLEH